jgi:hypothetical protein
MEPIVFITLIMSAVFTVMAFFATSTKRVIQLLALQAGAIGFFALMRCIVELVIGLQFEALISFFLAFAEWFTCAILSPLIIYWGMFKTKNQEDKPSIGLKSSIFAIFMLSVIATIAGSGLFFTLPVEFEALPFTFFIFAISIGLIMTRQDTIKILVGFNMAETALYPLMVESPLAIIPLMLVIMVFVNIIGVFVISQAYKEYGSLSIKDWRWTE